MKSVADIRLTAAFDAADIRGKALTLVLVSSEIREGAVPSLRVSNYSKLRTPVLGNDNSGMNASNSANKPVQQLVAGKLEIYHGEPESYSAFEPLGLIIQQISTLCLWLTGSKKIPQV